ncbi:MAG: TetR/AcrR family transcriptional regulator [Gemmatimonadaceae bacterium]|nr:TetR/AcrR family transcriptional regulator [Gemmatimonadaceae bacterium]
MTRSARGADLDTEARILEGARRVFIRRGTAGARVQEIAAEAGVNQALIHYYFGSKEALAERIFLEAAGRLFPALAVVADPTASLEELIRRFVQVYIDTVRATPYLPGYLLAEAQQNPARLELLMQRAVGSAPASVAGQAITRLRTLIDAEVAAGTMRPVAPRFLFMNVMSLVAFPFVFRPIISTVLGASDAEFEAILDERRRELPGFIMRALRG